MTIAQALRRVKKLKGRMGELQQRAASCVSFREDRKPAFDFVKVRSELDDVRRELIGLETAVARANAATAIEDGGQRPTLAEAIRTLQEVKAEMAWLPTLTLREGVEQEQVPGRDPETGRLAYLTREVRYVTGLTEVQRVAEIDALRDRFERLNDALESANHRTSVDWPPKER